MPVLAEKYPERIQKIFAKYEDKRSGIMDLLYLAQEEYGWLNQDALKEVAELCDVDPTQAHSIAGFYTMFREEPKGKYWLQVCTDLPCALRGADEFYRQLCDYLNVDDGGTTEDGMFTVEQVMCLAACDKAPMLQCNFHYHEKLDMEQMKALIAQWRAEAGRENPTE
ncbi:MAG TPA: NAD(P)H-dependent oxidoreductase subunit E [Aggregatilineaceae bacterium]|nr:NAD(P)H-dependent oxidoreductase subunit E [Aggregatilineaceae bacterium]